MYGRNDTDGWIAIANRVQNNSYTHIGMMSGISYFFVIRAENAHGISAPSPLSEPVILGMVSCENIHFVLVFVFNVTNLN